MPRAWLALIVDEVFLDYGLNQRGASFATGSHTVPTFVLSGLSKVAGLPQMKAAWIACFGAAEAMERLEVISDTFLSLSAPIQWALPAWLSQRATLQEQIRERLKANLVSLDAILLRQNLVTRLAVEAGWYAVLRVPGLQPEEQMALDLLLERGSGGALRGFLRVFWPGMAGGESAYDAGGIQKGCRGDVQAIQWPL